MHAKLHSPFEDLRNGRDPENEFDSALMGFQVELSLLLPKETLVGGSGTSKEKC